MEVEKILNPEEGTPITEGDSAIQEAAETEAAASAELMADTDVAAVTAATAATAEVGAEAAAAQTAAAAEVVAAQTPAPAGAEAPPAKEATPAESAPAEATPAEAAPTEATPAEAAATEAAPVEAPATEAAATVATPAESAPAEATLAEAAAADTAPAKAGAPAETMEDLKDALEESYKAFDERQTLTFVEETNPDAEKWSEYKQMMVDKTPVKVKVKEIVKGGAVAFVDDVRGFIPASQLSLRYVEDLNEFLGKYLDVVLITVDPEKKRLVLSAKEILKEQAEADKKKKMDAVKVGAVVEGTVDSVKDYGAFVNLDDGLSGLLHVSRISRNHIKHPGDVLKEGQRVTVKIVGLKDGKISLSMKDLEGGEAAPKDDFHYKETGQATTGLGDLLKGIRL
ncbi:MAG: S1 RNA-binding domain-containing protein [Lachnospiraceae bacterium]|jgi:small subunit ribosomal protein S1|nr:S1 RNA-binding domain-containing protein [Lachnospiraceae bacterium]